MKTVKTFMVRAVKDGDDLTLTTMVPSSEGWTGILSSFCYDLSKHSGDLITRSESLSTEMGSTFVAEMLGSLLEKEKYQEETGL